MMRGCPHARCVGRLWTVNASRFGPRAACLKCGKRIPLRKKKPDEAS